MRKSKQKPRIAYTHTCRECKYSRDYQNVGYNGEFIFCECDFQKYTRFLDMPKDCCEHFAPKEQV